jgi:hypothetical protein
MENLVPREAYDVDGSGYRERLGMVSGILFGFAMAVVFLFLTPTMVGFGLRILIIPVSNPIDGRIWLAHLDKYLPRSIVRSRFWKALFQTLSKEDVFDD